MKRRDLLLAVPGSVLVGSGLVRTFPSVASAQDDPRVREVAAALQAFYQQRRTIQARFTQTFRNRIHRTATTSRGRLAIQRPAIRFDYDPPNGLVAVSDETTWTMYEPIEGGPGQYSHGTARAASLGALRLLTGTIDLSTYRQSLRARRGGDPAATDALVLVPITPDPHYRQIVVHVGNLRATSGFAQRVDVEDPDGNWNTFVFAGATFDRDLAATTFQFTPPAGARQMGGA